ncbi:hypothetical protein CSUI_007994 [Cystoisospora suis]|uniref:Uncharacterized protein n=1 Tax=Cystoisospora suis TaxID=483139 RepID=A0A2C6JRH8_9APIC|nr:hypothetical protein CSUI_007994 [Cystoisospora suis]
MPVATLSPLCSGAWSVPEEGAGCCSDTEGKHLGGTGNKVTRDTSCPEETGELPSSVPTRLGTPGKTSASAAVAIFPTSRFPQKNRWLASGDKPAVEKSCNRPVGRSPPSLSTSPYRPCSSAYLSPPQVFVNGCQKQPERRPEEAHADSGKRRGSGSTIREEGRSQPDLHSTTLAPAKLYRTCRDTSKIGREKGLLTSVKGTPLHQVWFHTFGHSRPSRR